MKLNYIQKIALCYLSLVDKNRWIFGILKTLNLPLRMFFYIGLPISSYVVLILIGNAIINSGNPFYQLDIVIYLSNIILYAVPGLCLLYLSFESIYNLDFEKIIAEEQEKKKQIIKCKKQLWRLRNLHYSYRVVLYLTVYISLLNIIKYYALLAIFETYQNPSEQQLIQINNEYTILLSSFTFLYAMVIVILDTSVYYKRKKSCQK
ncbi:MAG: hypothetical protein COB42_00415 [Sulfurimonas sp.]|nr:MAG: hypothetical protein COB42_00415 [Sulfurimonas sp.]